jgi:GNAT superfamily N-acetyltransferase
VHLQRELPAMALDLRSRPERPAPGNGLSLTGVEPEAGLTTLFAVIREAFGFPELLAEGYRIGCETVARTEGDVWRHYLGRIDGEPAVAAQLHLTDTIGGLYHVATRPRFGRLGRGTTVTRWALAEAWELGCRTVVLYASLKGQPIYERLGFREVCRIGFYGD